VCVCVCVRTRTRTRQVEGAEPSLVHQGFACISKTQGKPYMILLGQKVGAQ
jgi:hypothetical protein